MTPVGWGLLLGDDSRGVGAVTGGRLPWGGGCYWGTTPVGWGLLLGDDSRGVGAVTGGRLPWGGGCYWGTTPVGWGLLLGDDLPSVSSRLSRDPDLTRFLRPVGWGLLLGDDSRDLLLPLALSVSLHVPRPCDHAFTLYRSVIITYTHCRCKTETAFTFVSIVWFSLNLLIVGFKFLNFFFLHKVNEDFFSWEL